MKYSLWISMNRFKLSSSNFIKRLKTDFIDYKSLTNINYLAKLDNLTKNVTEKYRNVTGITDVQIAQDNVTKLTESLLEAQETRRAVHIQVENINQELLSTHQLIAKTELYSDDHVHLFDKARHLTAKLKSLREQFSDAENTERSTFNQLSVAIKFCNDQEKTSSENSKYFSIIVSVISLSFGSGFAYLNNSVRFKNLKNELSQLKNQLNQLSNDHGENKKYYLDILNKLNTNSVASLSPSSDQNLNTISDIKTHLSQVLKDQIVPITNKITELIKNNENISNEVVEQSINMVSSSTEESTSLVNNLENIVDSDTDSNILNSSSYLTKYGTKIGVSALAILGLSFIFLKHFGQL